MCVRRAVIAHAESQPIRTCNFRPRAYDVPLWTYVNAVPRLMFRVPAIEVVVVSGQRDQILGPARLYSLISASGSHFSAFHKWQISLYPNCEGWP